MRVLEHVTERSRAGLLAGRKEVLDERQQLSAGMILDELKTGRPLQYVLGETEFYGLRFNVNEAVLIPRPETEELVEWVIQEVAACALSRAAGNVAHAAQRGVNPCILDIGTGSGCIAVSLAKHLPEAGVWACDISRDALEVAACNAVLHKAQVHFRQADILDESTWQQFPEPDIVVSNPPYITERERQSMHMNVLEHEPAGALFVPDQAPLLYYRSIARFAGKKLKKGGKVYVEINESYGKEVKELFENEVFEYTELKKDLSGKDRMLKAVISDK